jgi:uncharacterized damage-inducible protein DinB
MNFARLFDHLAWADRRLLDALRASKPIEPTALRVFSHIVSAEAIWLARVCGENSSGLHPWPNQDIQSCAELSARNIDGFRAVVDALHDSGETTDVVYRNTQGKEFRNRLSDVLLHVALHGSYHRGQIALLMRQSGGEPIVTDFIAFARE